MVTKDFVESIRKGKKPRSDGNAGLNVVRILEAATSSLKQGGKVIKFSSNGYQLDDNQLTIFGAPKSVFEQSS